MFTVPFHPWLSAVVTLLAAGLTAIPPTLAALAALRQGQSNSKKADVVAQQGRIAAVKTETLLVKTDEIHTATNGNLTALKAALDEALLKISTLENMIAAQGTPR